MIKFNSKYVLIPVVFYCLLVFCTFSTSASRPNPCDRVKLKSRLSLFQEATNELGAASPEEAADLWAKGIQSRNGALQYTVMSSNLKERFSSLLNEESESWVTGGSSPWVEKYSIKKSEEKGPSACNVVIEFDLQWSGGSLGGCNATLTVTKENRYWVISEISMDDTLKYYLRFLL